MKCSLFPGGCSWLLITIIVCLIIAAIVACIRYRRCCTLLPSLKTIKPTKISLYSLRYPFTLPPLKYNYKALEPHVDAETMQLHHSKHHQAYIDNANKALADAPEFQKYTLEELLANLDALPTSIKKRIANHGGGHFNHSFFWDIMSPQGGGRPGEILQHEIDKAFGSFDSFKQQFEKAAQSQFGSGWAWLCITPTKHLTIISTANQDSPLAQGLYPILALDVWEHAYYLKYRNKRPDYISAWWNVVNWKQVETFYQGALKQLA